MVDLAKMQIEMANVEKIKVAILKGATHLNNRPGSESINMAR